MTDLPLRNPVVPSEIWDLPEGVQIADQQVSFRGLCPACSYPVGTSPLCTECGKPVRPRAGAAS